MRIFATEIMEEVKGKQTFEKLVIDGTCFLDEFTKEIEQNPQHYSEYKTIVAYMDFVANGKSLPATKFREIKGGKVNAKRYEFKSKNLRIYAFNKPNGKIVVLGGYKKTQEKDIAHLNSIVKEYLTNQSDK